jgi:hypothetical protein
MILGRYRAQTGDQMRSGSGYENRWQRQAARPGPEPRHRGSGRRIGVVMIERQLITKTPENHRNRQPNKSESAGSADRSPQGMRALYLDIPSEHAGLRRRGEGRKFAPVKQFFKHFLLYGKKPTIFGRRWLT